MMMMRITRMKAHRGVRGLHTLLLVFLWTSLFRCTVGIHRFTPRIRVKRETFASYRTLSGNMTDNLKLILDPHSGNVYAGFPHGLFMLNPGNHPNMLQVHVPLFESVIQTSSTVGLYEVTLLKEGRNGHPLYMCGTIGLNTKCCDVSSEHLPLNCTDLEYKTQIHEPSLHAGDSLYYTISDKKNNPGLYRRLGLDTTYTMSKDIEQRYVKLLANHGNTSLDGKVYSFYMEQSQNQDPEVPVWIPRVSQICMADLGGSKAVLQFKWTSMLTARLFCGDEKKHLSYTELLDVAVLEDTEWENTTIYTLFKNAYNLSAVCVYKMSDIIQVFMSNKFTVDPTSLSERPGECVESSSKLSVSFLKFMERHPELKQWIKPVRDPLLFHHHHYTHLQVDRMERPNSGHSHDNVLLMSLEHGQVHKILVQDGDPFIITEYEPFNTNTHISSMLLDSKTKKLFVSSRSEVVEINLHTCSVYGKDCESCVMARDPYCSWDFKICSANSGNWSANSGHKKIQDVSNGNPSICAKGDPKTSMSQVHRKGAKLQQSNGVNDPSIISIPQKSKFYLSCPIASQHASYSWHHQQMKKECVTGEQQCLFLIDSMSKKDEGDYKCIASENGYNRTLVYQKLQMNTATEIRMTHLSLACLLFLISVIY